MINSCDFTFARKLADFRRNSSTLLYIMSKFTSIVLCTAGVLAAMCAATTQCAADQPTLRYKVSAGFIPPAPPSQSAKPDPKLPRLGRDKHGMPFYHPAQLNRVVRTTAYTHTESDHLAYGPRNAVGTSLKYTDQVRSAAADWSVYPLGTRFKIKGEPYIYVVDDYGSALVGTGTIDIYQPTHELMRKWGRRIVEIQIIQWGSPQLSMEKLAGRRGYSHCARMYAALQQQARYRNTAKK